LELEILGHLRAPQFVLYQKYSEKHKDDVGILSKAIGFLGGNRIAKWFNRPPDGSIKLVENNEIIQKYIEDENYDLDIVKVKTNDVNQAVSEYYQLKKEGNEHAAIIETLQKNVIERKSASAINAANVEKPKPKTIKALYKS